MNLQSGQKIKVYKGKNGYFTYLNKFDSLREEWSNACIYLNFKKGVELEHGSQIIINDSWLSCYNSKKTGKVVLYVFVNDFVLDTE